ncbi:MAG: hypothetical protein KDA28_08980, partial [Phycisphaerales bacterium]|nr:hypothetical protein [Phycisphaerales bacterium]
EPDTPDTDEGWVYATTTPDARTIVEAGRIESCIECHEQTTRDRMYGPRWSWPYDRRSGERLLPLRSSVPSGSGS